jgi:hypothetical protein
MPALEFTLMVGCPLRCTFCPQDALRAQYGDNEKYMSVETFKRIVCRLPPDVRIDFSGMAEPWANHRATDMLEYALSLGRSVAIYTTLYGMSDPTRVADLIFHHQTQIDIICLHLPDANGNMRGFKPSDEWMAAYDAINTTKRFVHRFEVMTMDDDGRVHEVLGAMKLPPWSAHSRAGNIDVKSPQHHSPVMCAFTPFYDQNVVLPNGDVVLCCMDYSLKHKIGNLLHQDYYEVFAGPELGRLHAENMRRRFSTDSLCRTCDRAQALTPVSGGQFWTT